MQEKGIIKNPVSLQEFRIIMRDKKAMFTLVSYLFILLGIFYLVYLSIRVDSYSWRQGNLGKDVFVWLAGAQLLMMAYIVPGFTVGAISSEREKKTFDLLIITLLKPWEIVWGKFFGSFYYPIILIVGPIPLVTLCLLFGGLSPKDIAVAYAILFSTALCYSLVGLYVSTITQKTLVSTIITYSVCSLLLVGLFIIGVYINAIFRVSNDRFIALIGVFSPLVAFIDYYTGSSLRANFVNRLVPLWFLNVCFNMFLSFVLLGLSVAQLKYLRRSAK